MIAQLEQPAFTLFGMGKKRLPEASKKVAVGARVTPEVLSAIQSIANADDRTLSYMVERAIREFVEKHGTHSQRSKR